MIYTNISGPSQYDGEGAKGWQGFTRIEKKRCIHAQLPVGLITFVDHVKTWSGSLKQGLSGFVCAIQIDDLGHGDSRPENYTMRIRVQSRDTNNNLYTSSTKCSSNVENQCKLSCLISSRDRKETLVSWYIYILFRFMISRGLKTSMSCLFSAPYRPTKYEKNTWKSKLVTQWWAFNRMRLRPLKASGGWSIRPCSNSVLGI